MRGVPELREAVARMMERFVVPGFPLNPNKLCISAGALHVHGRNAVAARCSRTSICLALQPARCMCCRPANKSRRPAAGCTAIIDNTIYALCDEGDGVLIPAPYYPAFDNDLQVR